MNFRFCSADFHCLNEGEELGAAAAEEANRLLDKHVASLPEVFAQGSPDRTGGIVDVWAQNKSNFDSGLRMSRARLWGVEEIKPEKCDHKNKRMVNYSLVAETCKWAECADCGKRLVAKWEPVE